MRYEDARDMTVWEYNRKIIGFGRSDDRQWHKLRVLGTIFVTPHLKKGKKIKPEDLIPLSDDIKQNTLTDEQKKEDLTRKLKAFKSGKREPFIKR